MIAPLLLTMTPSPSPVTVVRSEFIYRSAPFPQCHASTIAQAVDGTLIAAWFGGTEERNADVCIYVSRRVDGGWSIPVEAASGWLGAGTRMPCWNPVLFQVPHGPLLLFYKIGPSPATWRGYLRSSRDDGRTWSAERALPAGIIGPDKNPPILLPGGDLLCASSTEDHGWRVHFERTADHGLTWQSTPPINDGAAVAAIQPAILRLRAGRLRALLRTKQQRIYQTDSADGGRTWSAPTPTALPNPNCGIDAITLRDGRFLLVYNHSESNRTPLNVAVSRDGERWEDVLTLEGAPGEFSYPTVMETSDGRVHIVYTWNRRRIRHVELAVTALE